MWMVFSQWKLFSLVISSFLCCRLWKYLGQLLIHWSYWRWLFFLAIFELWRDIHYNLMWGCLLHIQASCRRDIGCLDFVLNSLGRLFRLFGHILVNVTCVGKAGYVVGDLGCVAGWWWRADRCLWLWGDMTVPVFGSPFKLSGCTSNELCIGCGVIHDNPGGAEVVFPTLLYLHLHMHSWHFLFLDKFHHGFSTPNIHPFFRHEGWTVPTKSDC